MCGIWVETQTDRWIPHERVVVGIYGGENDGWSFGPVWGIPGGAYFMARDLVGSPGWGNVFEDDLTKGEPSMFTPLTP